MLAFVLDRNIFDDTASSSYVTDDNNVILEVEVEYKEVGNDGVSSEGEKTFGQDGNQVSNCKPEFILRSEL